MTAEAIQAGFAAALRRDAASVPEGVAAGIGALPVRRFAVHRGNHQAGLVRSLSAQFPVTEALVGEAFFAVLAMAFAEAHPPRSPVLHEYGAAFPAFVASFEPAAGLPYLSDVARLEAARGTAYHARDAAPLVPAAFAALPSDQLPRLRFALHPSAALVASAHPIVTVWSMNVGHLPLGPIEAWGAEAALVIRPRMVVHLHRLSIGGAAFVAALADGQALGSAVEAAVVAEPGLDVPEVLARTIDAGLFTSVV